MSGTGGTGARLANVRGQCVGGAEEEDKELVAVVGSGGLPPAGPGRQQP